MQVTTICGELKLHNEIHTRVKNAIVSHDFSLIVVFPTLSLLHTVEEELLNLPGTTGLGGVRFLLFEGFIGEVRDSFGLNDRQATMLERNLIMKQICQELELTETLIYLNRVSFTQNYRQSLLDSIAEWKRSGLTMEIFDDWAQEKGIKEIELALLYKHYQAKLIQHNLVEEDLTLEELQSLRLSGFLPNNNGNVILYGFTDLTTLQTDYLKVLENWFDFEVIIDPTVVPEFQNFAADHFGFKQVNFEKPSHSRSSTGLQVLQNVFWQREPEPIAVEAGDQSIKIIEVSGLIRQIDSVAREIILQLQANPSYTIADFLILTPKPKPFTTLGRSIFAKYGLGLNDEVRTLQETPVIQEYIHLLKSLTNDWQWQDMQYLIRQVYVGEESKIADGLLLQIGKRYGALSGRNRWLGLIKNQDFFQQINITEILINKFKRLVEWLADFSTETTLLEYLTLTRQWFEIRCQTTLRYFKHQNNTIFQEQLWNYQAVNCLIEAINELLVKDKNLWYPEQQLTIEQFQIFFEEFFLELEIKRVNPKRDGIRVLPPREARGLQAKVVFIIGLEQGVFPRQYISDWKLDSEARFELKLLGINLETGDNYLIQEKLAFYWSLQAAVDQLVLVLQSQGANGDLLNRSTFLNEVLQWLPRLAEQMQYYPLGPTLCERFGMCRNDLERKELWVHYLSQSISTIPLLEQDICNQLIYEPKYYKLAQRVNHWNLRKIKTRIFETDSPANDWLLSKFGSNSIINITALEDYRSCPYRFFLKYVLRVCTVNEPSYLPEAIDLGELYHTILRDFYQQFLKIGLEIDDFDRYRELIQSLLQKHFNIWLERVANDIAKVVLDLNVAEISKNLNSWLKAELDWINLTGSQFKPQLLEYGFGSTRSINNEQTADPYRFELGEITALISGRIDRVDADQHNNFIVYDYKLGQGLTAKELVEIAKIQIPVYILALEQLFFGKNKAVGGCYLAIKNSSHQKGGIWQQTKVESYLKSKSVLSTTEWEEWLNQVRQEVALAIKGIRTGNFKTVISCLPYCEYQSCCRKQELLNVEMEVNGHNVLCTE